ncbi:hypothetical protein [Marinitoga lauensis]|uniref:HflX-like GTP-binding protein n=1 Tax=Marinitoga lauensis TaxID=2201189 RepID=UPI001404C52D|nr:hypothetical protein [Marinitoga lauensis]
MALNFGDIDFEKQIEELKLLCENIGIQIITEIYQKRSHMDKKYYVGKGKFYELSELVKAYNVEVVVFNDALSNTQRKNIQDYLGKI